jgi:hypothetical protein
MSVPKLYVLKMDAYNDWFETETDALAFLNEVRAEGKKQEGAA